MRISALKGFNYFPSLKNVQKTSNYTVNTNYQPKLNADTVTFSGKYEVKPVNVETEMADKIAHSYETSTAGHRAEYMGETFTPPIVNLITLGMADYVKEKAEQEGHKPTILIGGDTRQATRESLPLIRDTLAGQGIDVIHITEPVPSPLLAYAAEQNDIDLAVLMTASHNPWKDGGYNFVTDDGAIAGTDITQKIAQNIRDIAERGVYTELKTEKGNIKEIDPFDMYYKRISKGIIDWDKIRDSGLTVYYDGLEGTGNYVVPKLLKKKGIPFIPVKSSGQEGPNPTEENLSLLKDTVSHSDKTGLVVGFANDGDADRFGVIDEKGNFISTNDVLLLVAHHLADNKGVEGAIVRSQSTSEQIDKIAEKHNLDVYETPVGFKYLGSDILKLREQGSDILIAGEESGGLTVNGHIPEKDGIIAISLIMDLMAEEEKPLSTILSDLKKDIGTYYVSENISKKFPDDESKNKIMQKAEKLYDNAVNGDTDFYGTHEIDVERTVDCKKRMESYKQGGDGYKFFLTDGSNVLMRKSGTEPMVRCRIESTGKTLEEAQENFDIINNDLVDFFKL
ncbi:hypothetical protein IJ182_08440 [bacterium]|nr:hypothetical protein [bacterium]